MHMETEARIPGRGRRAKAYWLSWAAVLGALLVLPQDVLAQKEGTGSKSSSGSSSSARSGSSSSRPSVSRPSSSSRSSGSSRSRSVSRSKSYSPKASSRSSGSRSRSVSRSKPTTRSSAPKASVSRPRSSTSSRSFHSGPKINRPETPTGRPTRGLIDAVTTDSHTTKKGGKKSDHGDDYYYRYRRRHYSPYGYYNPYYGGYGYYGHYSSYYRHGYPYYFYGPYGYFYNPYSYGYGTPRRSSYQHGESLGALDLNVKPKKAEVYINGNAVGPVDRYDGYPSYLWLEPGNYTISFYLEGYQTLTKQYLIHSEVVVAIKEQLIPGTAVLPEVIAPEAPAPTQEESILPNDSGVDVGRLLVSIQPEDTAIYLDGHFLGTAAELQQLSAGMLVEPGHHVLELVRPGYITEQIPINVPSGDRIGVELEMRKR